MKNIIKASSSFVLTFLLGLNVFFAQTQGKTDRLGNMMFNVFYADDISYLTLQRLLVGSSIPIIFSIIFGTYIYNDLIIGSVYIFTRQKSRTKWYLMRCLRLFLYSIIYAFGFSATQYLLTYINTNMFLDKDTLIMIFNVFITTIVLSFVFCIIINMFVIFFGSNKGYMFSILFIVLSTFLVLITLSKPNNNIFYINPIYCFVLCFETPISLLNIFIELLCMFLVTILGYIVIKRFNIGLSNKEL